MNHQLFASKIKNLIFLYIEDDIKIQAYLAEFLKRYTQKIYLSSNAEEGLELVKKISPDIILLDINLPGINGIEFVRQLRKSDQDTRIIISTAYTDKEFLLTAIELSITRYLVKPITGGDLVDAVSKAADEYKKICGDKDLNLGEGFTYNYESKALFYKNIIVTLRRKEMQLLEFFIANAKQILTYESLQYEVWQDSLMSKDAIRAQIRNLRKKSHKNIVTNITAIGYKLYQKD